MKLKYSRTKFNSTLSKFGLNFDLSTLNFNSRIAPTLIAYQMERSQKSTFEMISGNCSRTVMGLTLLPLPSVKMMPIPDSIVREIRILLYEMSHGAMSSQRRRRRRRPSRCCAQAAVAGSPPASDPRSFSLRIGQTSMPVESVPTTWR